MKKKGLILIIAFYIMGVIQSCDRNFCEDVDFYDFSKLSVAVTNNVIEQDDSLSFKIQQLDTRYMVQNQGKFELIQSIYALNCDYGWKGMKFPVTRIEITSDADYNEDYPANTLINDLLTVRLLNEDYQYEIDSFSNVSFDKILPRNISLEPDLYIVKKPSMDLEHKLTVKIFKSNGDTLTTRSEILKWR